MGQPFLVWNDEQGKPLPLSGAQSVIGGGFANGPLPQGITGPGADVTMVDRGYFGKRIERATNGLATFRGEDPSDPTGLTGEDFSAYMQGRRATYYGTGAGAKSTGSSNNTRRHWRIGWVDDAGQNGAWFEWRSLDDGSLDENGDPIGDSYHLVGMKNGVITRKFAQFPYKITDYRPYSMLFSVDVVIRANIKGGGWELALFDDFVMGSTYHDILRLEASEVEMGGTRAILEWDWTYPTGNFSDVTVNHFSDITYWSY